MDKCCGNCDWWDKDGKEFDETDFNPEYQVCLYVLEPGNMRQKLGEMFDEHPVCGILEKTNTPDWREYHKKIAEASQQIRVHSNDASNYMSTVSTRKDHYCSAWEAEK